MIMLRQTTCSCLKFQNAKRILYNTHGYNAVVSSYLSNQNSYMPSISKQQSRLSSYYTFPAFTAMQYVLENFHTYSMLPWWGTILGSTLIFRFVVTFPLSVKQNLMITRTELLKPALEQLIHNVRRNVTDRGKREGKAEDLIKKDFVIETSQYEKNFRKQHGITRFNLFALPLIQVPLWITMSFALRNISGFTAGIWGSNDDDLAMYTPSPGIETEGFFWCSNLAVADPTYILPTILLISNIVNLEFNKLMQKESPSRNERIMYNAFRCLLLCQFYIATQFPVAISLYWAVSSLYGVGQNIALKFPTVRRKVGLPVTPSETAKPISFLLGNLKKRTDEFLEINRKK